MSCFKQPAEVLVLKLKQKTNDNEKPSERFERDFGALYQKALRERRRAVQKKYPRAFVPDLNAEAMLCLERVWDKMNQIRTEFLELEPLDEERFDSFARDAIHEKADLRHREELIGLFTRESVSKKTAEKIVDRYIECRPSNLRGSSK